MSARLAPASLYVRSSRRGVGGCGCGRLRVWAWGVRVVACLRRGVGGVVRGVARPVDHGADVGLEDMLWYPGSSRCWMACSARWVDTWALGCAR